MTDADLTIHRALLKKKSKDELVTLCLIHLINIEVLRDKVRKLLSNNKVGKKRGGDEDIAFTIFVNVVSTLKKRPTLKEWNDIVGNPEIRWSYETLKVKTSDPHELLENGLTKSRAKGWYYRFSKQIELFLKQKLENNL